jgi:hypothetical protein
MSAADQVLALVQYLLARPDVDARVRVGDTHRLLAKYHAERLEAALAPQLGQHVRRGPFEGMHLPPGWSNACYLPKLLGTYERELQPVIDAITRRDYRCVVNAGCAEGYYAVGLALRLPAARVLAFDSDDDARARCTELAELNGVQSRVEVHGALHPGAFADLAAPALLLCDIEGAEDELLDPGRAPALRELDVLVEVHDVFAPGVAARVAQRFATSHDVESIASGGAALPTLPELEGRDQLDQLLSLWEGRLAGTSWLWMRAR